MAKTLIVSDLHLGAWNSRTEAILGVLGQDFDRLVLNGDTLDHLNFRRYLPEHWAVLEQLRLVAKEREVILLRGNHEGLTHLRTYSYGPLDVLAQMLDLPMQEEFEFWVGRRKYVVFHGDVYDRTLRMVRLSHAADEFYRLVQRCSQPAARWLKMRVKHWGGVVQRLRDGAVQLAKERRCQGVILGHVHFAEDAWVEGVHYLNTGCWVESPCTYVLADEHAISLRTWQDAPVQGRSAQPEPANFGRAAVPSRALAAAAT